MNSMVAMIGAIFSGGATGILGILLQKFFDYKAKNQELELVKINHQHAVLLAQMEANRLQISLQSQERIAADQAAAQVTMAMSEAQTRQEEAESKDYIASVEADKASYVSPSLQARHQSAGLMMARVDMVRGLVRPFLTLYLVILSTAIFVWAQSLVVVDGAPALGAESAVAIVKSVIETLLYLATTCVVWWFGVRPSARRKEV